MKKTWSWKSRVRLPLTIPKQLDRIMFYVRGHCYRLLQKVRFNFKRGGGGGVVTSNSDWPLQTVFLYSVQYKLCINWSPISLSPAINLSPVSPAIIVHRCRCHWWEIYRRCQWHRRSLKIRDKDYLPASLTPAINLSPISLAPVNSLSPVSLTPVINIHSRLSLRIFWKNLKRPQRLEGPGDNNSWEKPEVENLVSDSL